MKIKKYYGQLPPYHNLAEEVVLGGVLINSKVAQMTLIELEIDAFAIEVHQILYRIILDIIMEYDSINPIILIDKLWNLDLLHKIGGIKKIIHLVKQAQVCVSSSIDDKIINYYIRLIKEQYIRRLLIQYGYNIVDRKSVV